MNLSPEWQAFLSGHGIEAEHWSVIGAHDAPDREIMRWARENGRVVFTHDLDFGILLAHTRAGGPSVIQARTQEVSPQHLGPQHLGPLVLRALQAHGAALASGALLTIDESRSKVRILPI